MYQFMESLVSAFVKKAEALDLVVSRAKTDPCDVRVLYKEGDPNLLVHITGYAVHSIGEYASERLVSPTETEPVATKEAVQNILIWMDDVSENKKKVAAAQKKNQEEILALFNN